MINQFYDISQHQTMQVTTVRNLLGLGGITAAAVGARFNHNYYYYGYQGDRIWQVGQEYQSSALSVKEEVKKENNEGMESGKSVDINKSED